MDNAQLTAPDGRWFLFADWQGMTRIRLPGDELRTDVDLDRPGEPGPLALREGGRVRSTRALDIDPDTLTAHPARAPGPHTPDPLGGPDLELRDDGQELLVRGRTVRLTPRGGPIDLGGAPGRCEQYGGTHHALYTDHSMVVYFAAQSRTHVALVVRTASGAGRLRWCYPVLRPLGGSPDAFRERGSTWLTDRDPVHDIASLLEVPDDGPIGGTVHAPAVAGPWVHAGRIWWQPDDATLCAGPRLGEPAESFTLAPEHAGPGRLLRLTGRRLFVPWHGGVVLDLADTRALPRGHQPADAAMYLAAERLLRPIRRGMARRGARVRWIGCTRVDERVELRLEISGTPDLVTYILAHALDGAPPPALLATRATAIRTAGGRTPDLALARPAGEQDLLDLVAMFDAAGIPRARGFVALHELATFAADRGAPLQLAPEVESFALAAVLSGLRGETDGPVPLALDDDLADAAALLADRPRLAALGLHSDDLALFLTIFGHRALGPAAAAPAREALLAQDPDHARTLARALGLPLTDAAPPLASAGDPQHR